MLKASTEYQLYQAAQSVAKIFEETNKRAEEISSRASAQRFRIEIDAKIKESIQKIDDKNTEMKSSFDERAFTEGYTVKNGYYRKKIVKDVSVFSVDTENVKVRMWKDFEANDPEVNLSLLEENVDAVSFSVIMTLVSAQLTDWENSIFGVSGLAATNDEARSTKNVSYIVGEFEKYAYGEQYKGEVELGKGLVGKILLDFENNSQKEKAGWEALDAPTWERKLWCSDTFPGPSIREFSTMVASIAATVCTFGAGALLAVAVSAAVMAANELTFEMADVSVGYHDWDEAAKNVAKAAVSGAISGASGAAMGMASKVGGIGGVFLKTGITSSSSITTQFTNAFIDGGFSGVKDAFNSWSDWQGIAFSTAGSFVTNGLGAMNSFDSTGKLLNGNTFNTSAMSSFNSLAGGLTTNALEFAFTGQTTFNLANLSMLGLEYGSMWGAAGTGTISGGFLSMTIGENGTHFAISSAGTDISLGTLKLAAAGAKESSKVIDWKYGSVETNNNLSVTNYLSYSQSGQNQTLAKDLWSGDTKIEYTDGSNGDLGYHDKENKVIYISKLLLDGGTEGVLQSTSIASHENEHIVGKNEFDEFAARVVGYDTYNELKELFGIENSGKYDNVSDIDSLATMYKEEGAQALFEVLFLSGAFNEDSVGHYITNSSDIHWLQQQYKQLNLPLGEGISKDKIEEYDKQQKEIAYNKYCKETPDNEEISFADFSDPKKNYLKKYGYTQATFVNLGDQGCTLSTAVFMYYSITGNFMTLDEANSKLAAAGLFDPSYITVENGKDKYSIKDDGGQELYLSYGRTYANAVNALAGEEIITYSNSYWQENDLKKVMIDLQKAPEYYFIHGRTSTPGHPNNTNYHSVLIRDFTYDESGNITGVKVNDPWYGYNTNKDFSNFYRFDVYKLTTTGFNNYAHKDNWYKYTRR